MVEALYRKYRPTTFGAVAEQQHVVRTVSNQLASGKVAHAYLFAGPRGVGKTTIARLLAKALNCEGRQPGEAEPCNRCSVCLDANVGRFLDTVEIDAASQTKVEETRENIIENVRFAPTRGKFKVFIIDEVHMLSTSSFNALLKTLEEPPAHAIFILATTELHKIPATIISRCQRFDFHRIPAKEMIERLQTIASLENVVVEVEVLAAIARLSEGCLRDAESLLGQVMALGEQHITHETASLIIPDTYTDVVTRLAEVTIKRDTLAALAIIRSCVEDGGSMRYLVDEFMEFVRSMLFASLGETRFEQYDPATLQALMSCAQGLPSSDLQRLLDLVLTARGRATPSEFPQLPLELALVQFCLGAPSSVRPQPTSTSNVSLDAWDNKRGQAMDNILPPYQPVTKIKLPNLPDAPVSATISVATETLPNTDIAVDNDVADLKSKWGRCVAAVGERNMALPIILNIAEILRIENGKVVIGFQYAMHVEKMNEIKNLRLVEEVVASVLMKNVRLTFIQSKAPTDEAVSNLLEAFGGSMV